MKNTMIKFHKKRKALNKQHAIHESMLFCLFLSFVGGFLDAYTYIARGGVFCNAQTGNIVLLGINASQGEWGQMLAYVSPILAFILGVLASEVIKNKTSRFYIFNWVEAILFFEIVVFFLIGWISDNGLVTLLASFVASIQVSSFRKMMDAPFATTMSTGNLKSASQAFYQALSLKDWEEALKGLRYVMIIVAFLFGAFIGAILTASIGIKAIWINAIGLVIAMILSLNGKND